MQRARASAQEFIIYNKTAGAVLGEAKKAMMNFAIAAIGAKGAQEIFNKTISSSQTLTDEYNRVMESAKGVVDSFFSSLAQGDFSGFLSGLNDVIMSARQAYDDLDRLGSMDVFKGKEDARYNEERARLRLEIKRNPNDQSLKKQLEELDAANMQRINEEADQARKAYLSSTISLLRKNNATGSDEYLGRQIEDKLKDFGSYEEANKRYLELKKRIDAGTTFVNTQGSSMFGGAGYGGTMKTDEAKRIENSQEYKLLRAISEAGDEALAKVNALEARASNARASTYQAQYRDEGLISGGRTGGKSGGATIPKAEEVIPEGSIAEMEKKLSEAQKAVSMAVGDSAQIEAQKAVDEIQKQLETKKLFIKLAATFDDSKGLSGAMEGVEPLSVYMMPKVDLKNKLVPKDIKKDTDDVENLKDQYLSVADAMGSVGDAFGSMSESFGSDALGKMSKAMLMAEAVAVMIAQLRKASGPWEFIAAIAAGTASIVGAFAQLNFAEGGVVPGHNYQDGITARVSSGEMVINEADQKRLYDSIHSGSFGGGSGVTRVKGEQLILAINNTAQRKGMGKLQFSY